MKALSLIPALVMASAIAKAQTGSKTAAPVQKEQPERDRRVAFQKAGKSRSF